MKTEKNAALLAVVFVAIIWGLSFLSIKSAVNVLPTMTLALLRFLIASALLFFVMKFKEPGTKLKKSDMGLMALSGIIGVAIYFYFENNGVKLITASAASIIVAAVPILTMISDALIFKNRLSKIKILSVIISAAGVYFVVGSDISGSPEGFLMMFGAAVSWVVYTVITKPLFKRYSQLAIVFYQALFGSIALLPFALFEKTDWSLVTPTVWLNVAYLGVFCSALAYYFYAFAMNKLGINISSLFINLIPVVTVAASYFIFKDDISFSQIAGGSLVIISVYLANINKRSKKINAGDIDASLGQ